MREMGRGGGKEGGTCREREKGGGGRGSEGKTEGERRCEGRQERRVREREWG